MERRLSLKAGVDPSVGRAKMTAFTHGLLLEIEQLLDHGAEDGSARPAGGAARDGAGRSAQLGQQALGLLARRLVDVDEGVDLVLGAIEERLGGTSRNCGCCRRPPGR